MKSHVHHMCLSPKVNGFTVLTGTYFNLQGPNAN